MIVSRADVERAARRIAGRVRNTPLVELELTGFRSRLLLKLENRQRCRCFKPRGALNAALKASELGPVAGLVTFSSGNHGQAVALAAQELGVPAIVVSPVDVRPSKHRAMEAAGARVILHGLTSSERMEKAREVAHAGGLFLVPPYDHADVIAGQGTIGLELDAAIPESFTVVVPIGGGGLSSGLAVALSHRSDVRLVGVEPEGADDARRSLSSGELQSNVGPATTACDGLRNSRLGDLNWSILRERIETIVTVSDDEVTAASALIEAAGHGPVEPSGAASTAAALTGRAGASTTLACIVSGGNA